MKKNKLRDQDKNKINKINQNQIMNLLIIRAINYKNKNKNKKFNNALKIETFKNKNELKCQHQHQYQTILKKRNLHTSIAIIVKNSIYNHASISILNLQKKNDK